MSKELSKTKKKAWTQFSRYIRLRDSVNGWGNCCTCGTKIYWKDGQAGHFVPGRTNAVLFQEEGVHLQCRSCNLFKGGSIHEYFDFMIKKYGEERTEEIRRERFKSVKYSIQDYKEIEQRYKLLADELENN